MRRVFILLTSGAFLALILLIAALSANGIYQLERFQKRMDTVVELHNRKIETVTAIQIDALMRADRLLRMAMEHDALLRNQLHEEFNRAGSLVGSDRQRLRDLGLTPEEKALFEQQSRLLEKIMPVQEKVAEMLARDQINAAWGLLVAEAIPMQESLNGLLDSLRGKLQMANNLALWDTQQEYRRILLFTLLAGIFATMLGAGLAWFTLRRLSANTREIAWQMRALEEARAAFEVEATHDAMTGLANRRLFYDRLRQASLHARRYGGKFGVLFVDLDDFKAVNDRYGHHVGDALLTEVAARLLKSVRESDTVARAGGDEFMILLSELESPQDCQAVADNIRRSLQETVRLQEVELVISASIGQAAYPDDGMTEDALLRAADASMYRLKTRNSRVH
jgi:diguanylate cyclase (GGDEF)-like protein